MKKIIILLSMSLIMTSCKKDFLDVNTDPSKVTSTDPKLILSSAIVNAAYTKGGEASKFSCIFSNQLIGADRQALSYSNYIISAGDLDNLWKYNYYSSSMKADFDLITQAKTQKKPHYQALGNILMAMSLTECSDMWGDIPYSEAFQGIDVISPKFDNQLSIYISSDKLLDEAISLLNASDNGVPVSESYDLLYGGDVTKWIKLAYGIKARNYIHLTKRDASYSQKALDAANMSLSSAADNAIVNFTTAQNNPWFQFNDNRGDIFVHDYFLGLIDADPRKDMFVNSDGMVGSYYASPSSPVDVLTYEEIKFIIAEAKANLGQDASSDFIDAVTANVKRVTGAVDAAFVSSVTADASLSNIMTQKYIAMFTSPQSWTDWRRTGFPALTPNTGGSIPRSLLYPSVEITANKNAPANTSIYKKVWWDL